MSEYEVEPVHGLPERPPEGEEVLWQGAPHWWGLACQAFHVRKVVAYFGLAIIALAGWDLGSGMAPVAVAQSALGLLIPMALAVALLVGLAWLYARMTVYTVTNRRVVIRSGIALPTATNLPFGIVASAGLKQHPDGTGEIALRLLPGHRGSFAMLWPNLRPWRWSNPEPALRALRDADEVGALLGSALAAESDEAGGAAEGADAESSSADRRDTAVA